MPLSKKEGVSSRVFCGIYKKMRAKKVSEGLEFQRGLDPKQSLGVGEYAKMSPMELLNRSDGDYLIYRPELEYSHIIVRMKTNSMDRKTFNVPRSWSTSLKKAKINFKFKTAESQWSMISWTAEKITREFLDDPDVEYVKKI